MSEPQNYFYLRLKENFFNTDAMILLEGMQDGYKYSNILLKLYLKSLKNGGKLMFNEKIPYNANMIATVTRHSVGDVEKALIIFQELNLIEILDTGAIYITDIQSFIGKSTTEADRKRTYREKIDQEKALTALPIGTNVRTNVLENRTNVRTNVGQTSDFSPPYIDIDTELDLDTKLDIKKDIDIHVETDEKTASVSHDDVEDLVGHYNNILGGTLPVVKKVTTERVKKVKAILKEFTAQEILLAFQKTANSKFLMGQTVNSNWKASWDWIMNKTNLTKVLEGNYDDAAKSMKKHMSVAEKLDEIETTGNERGINIWG